jgi:hypothetical protein
MSLRDFPAEGSSRSPAHTHPHMGEPVIVSVHVPKCAGTSFRHVLESMYGPRLWANYGAVFVRAQAGPGSVPDGTRAIHGHFMADAFDTVLPDCQRITWVRHPVERVVSNYHHFLRSPDMRDDCCRILHERRLTLSEFAELDWMRNEATRYLAGKPLSDFAAVGITERFEESLAWMATVLRWPAPPSAPRSNVNPMRLDRHYALSARQREYLSYLNAADLAWYQEAVELLEARRTELVTRAA